MREKRFPLWPLAAALTLCAVLAGVVLWQGGRLRDLRQGAPGSAANASLQVEPSQREETPGQGEMPNREALPDQKDAPRREEGAQPGGPEGASRLVEAIDFAPAGVDGAKGTASAAVSLRLWDEQPDAAVELRVRLGEETRSVPLTQSGDGLYVGTLTLPLPGGQGGKDEPVTLSAAVESGGVSAVEQLGKYPNTRFLTAAARADLKEGGMTYVRRSLPKPGIGLLRINPECRLSVVEEGAPVAVEDAAFLLYCNEKLVKELPAAEDEAGLYLYGPQPWDNALVCRNGDRVALAFSCTGGDGRRYEFQLETLRIVHGYAETAPRLLPPAVL